MAHVNAQQVEGFARCHAVLRRPRVVDRLEYFQFYYHLFAFRLFPGVVGCPHPLPATDGKSACTY
jgi:hypothetical protein